MSNTFGMDQMDDVQSSQQANNAYQIRCQSQSSLPPTAPTFTPQQQQYDPVHEAGRYQGNNFSNTATHAYQLPPAGPPWNSYHPMSHFNYADFARPGLLVAPGLESPQYTPPRPYMDNPYHQRGFEPFNNYHPGTLGNVPSSELNSGPSNTQTFGIGIPSHTPSYGHQGRHTEPWQPTQNQYPRHPPITPSTMRNNNERHSHHSPSSAEPHRTASNAARRSGGYRAQPNWPSGNRRLSPESRLIADGSSEDEDDEFIAEELRRRSGFSFEGIGDDEMQRVGTLARFAASHVVSKKVTAREFLAKLEVVPIDQVPEEDRNCSICYETIGTENPEGLMEKAVRMPRCKHIFGDICIKKWCQDSDTCPYCRDKLPSENLAKRTRALEGTMSYTSRPYIAPPGTAQNRSGHTYVPSQSGPSRFFGTEDFQRRVAEVRRIEEAHEALENQRRIQQRAQTQALHPATLPYPSEVESYAPMHAEDAFSWEGYRASDASERPFQDRRRNRGRVGTTRSPHAQGRPISGRFASNQQTAAPRPQVNLPSQISRENNVSSQPPLGSGSSSSGYGGTSSAAEEASSPPIAVGSGMATRQLDTAFRRSLELFSAANNNGISSPTRNSSSGSGPPVLGSPFGGRISPRRQESSLVRSNSNDYSNYGDGPLFSSR